MIYNVIYLLKYSKGGPITCIVCHANQLISGFKICNTFISRCHIQSIFRSVGFIPQLCACTIQLLNLMTENVLSMNTPQGSIKPTLTRTDVLSQYNDVFEGQGKFADELHLEVDEMVHPIQISTRKVPL